MRYLYIFTIASILVLSGCQEKKKDDFVSESLRDVTVSQSTQTVQPKPKKLQTIQLQNKKKIAPIGIEVDDGHIIIDTKKTKDFLESITKKIDQSFKQAAQDLKKNQIKSPNETGIIITQDRIEVDLNKTQKFMEKWIQSMDAIGKQLDNIAKELDKSFNP